ncbi:MAG: 5'/3'-nucleotidase SurE [Desulfobacterales bacterium]|nr:5'/3'-nucleotidase SurE [Desulfobacterales bacterium]
MNILLTNDDGIFAPGLWALHKQFSANHDITVVAPDRERSAIGHAITLHEPLRQTFMTVNGYGEGYAVNGTPADCVKLAITELLDVKPDIVISGINPGANAGVNLNYSGTVSAAREAALSGIDAIAVSMFGFNITHFDVAAGFIDKLALQFKNNRLSFGTFLNVNVPDLPEVEIKGVDVTRQAATRGNEYFETRVDPRNRKYYWQGLEHLPETESLDTDLAAICNNRISITPIKCDMTDYSLMDTLQTWELTGS